MNAPAPLLPKRALLSVSDKSGIVDLAQVLAAQGIAILSTGGTANALKAAGITITDVSEHTGFPEIMDGRVKTLQPSIHGGILARRDEPSHQDAMRKHNIAPIDIVVVNLYPFEQTVAADASYADAIENIDIGGPAMIRAAAKNHEYVAVLTDPADYAAFAEELTAGGISFALRQQLAAKAYARTAAYDAAISAWFTKQEHTDDWPAYMGLGSRKQVLRYGENPHQSAAFYVQPNAPYGIATAQQLQGKELSYNNINDTDAAWRLVSEFDDPAVAIIKHANPSGVAIGDTLTAAYQKALACDPVSAFGGILAINQTLDDSLVTAIASLFLEVIIAPAITDSAKAALSAKKNLRVLITGGMPAHTAQSRVIKSVLGGYLAQSADNKVFDGELTQASKRAATEAELRDLRFAFTVCKHVKSNAIVLAKDGASIGIGAGQMSRVDSVRLACEKARAAGLEVAGSVLASDAFFPFDDNVHLAAKAGVTALIQPGGSVRDEEVIAAADAHDMAMVLTGIRHFNH